MRLKSNKPHHGLGEHGHAREKKPLAAGAHMPVRVGKNPARKPRQVRETMTAAEFDRLGRD